MIYSRIIYAGVQGKTLIKILVRKLKRHLDKLFKLRIICRTKKLSYCTTKDKVPQYLKSHKLHEVCCLACSTKYIGKPDRNFGTHLQEHSSSDKKLPICNHLLLYGLSDYVVNLHSLLPSDNSVKYLEHVRVDVYDNTKIIDNSQNWVELCFLESLHNKWKKPN